VAFYRGADCVILVHDATNPTSFEHLEGWRKDFFDQAQPDNQDDFPFVVLGNKSDLPIAKQTNNAKIESWCRTKGELPYVLMFLFSQIECQLVIFCFMPICEGERHHECSVVSL